jgi:hypothetical protein
MAIYEAKHANTTFSLADLDTGTPLGNLGKDGVSCTLCHRIEETNLGTDASYSGNFEIINKTGDDDSRQIYGPYVPQGNNMRSQSGFTPTQGTHIKNSALCGTCHNLITEAIDPENPTVPTNKKFPEQMPYKEWLASDFSKGASPQSCQSCHMPVATGTVQLSNNMGGGGPTRRLAGVSKHHFVGGNAFMLTMLKENRAATGVVADDSAFDAAIKRTRDNLTRKTARLEASPCRVENTLTVPVTITNLTGHKFPTGYPNRRAWLHVKVVDSVGRVVFESGKPGVDGEIVDLASGTMPHYDTITQPAQVQIYETVMGDVRDNPTRRLMHAARYLKDNRLLPAGMSRAETDTDIRVVGNAATDTNFIGGSDKVTYSVNTTGYSGPFTVTAELLYQSVPPRDVAALDSYVTSQITSFRSMYNAANKAPERVASVTLNVP